MSLMIIKLHLIQLYLVWCLASQIINCDKAAIHIRTVELAVCLLEKLAWSYYGTESWGFYSEAADSRARVIPHVSEITPRDSSLYLPQIRRRVISWHVMSFFLSSNSNTTHYPCAFKEISSWIAALLSFNDKLTSYEPIWTHDYSLILREWAIIVYAVLKV